MPPRPLERVIKCLAKWYLAFQYSSWLCASRSRFSLSSAASRDASSWLTSFDNTSCKCSCSSSLSPRNLLPPACSAGQVTTLGPGESLSPENALFGPLKLLVRQHALFHRCCFSSLRPRTASHTKLQSPHSPGLLGIRPGDRGGYYPAVLAR